MTVAVSGEDELLVYLSDCDIDFDITQEIMRRVRAYGIAQKIEELKTHGDQWDAWMDSPDELVPVSSVIKWYQTRIEELKAQKEDLTR